MVDYTSWVLLHAGCLLLILLASAGAGHVFLHKMTFSSWAERVSFTVALGLGLWAFLFFCLGLIGLLYRQVIWVSTVLSAAGTILHLMRTFHRKSYATFDWLKELRTVRGLIFVLCGIIGVAYAGLLLLTTQYPSIEWDGNSHHLVLSRYFLEDHRVTIYNGVWYPVLPALNHMLFTWALALQDDVLAQMIPYTFLILIVMGLYSWGKRQNRSAFGIAAAASFLVHPLIIWLSEAAYVDLGLTCFVFLGVYALRIFWDTGAFSWWFVSMACSAMAAATKLPGLFALTLGIGIGLYRMISLSIRRQAPIQLKRALVKGLLLAFLVIAPWYGFITFHTGNPLWPTFAKISHGEESPRAITPQNVFKLDNNRRGVINFLKLPYNTVYYPKRFKAEFNSISLSGLIIAWPVAWIVSLWNPSIRWWTLWALAYTIFWFTGPQILRYWLPALPIITIAFCESLQWIVERLVQHRILRNGIFLIFAFCCLLISGNIALKRIQFYGSPPVNFHDREKFLARMGIGYRAVSYINKNVKENERIYILNANWLNYHLKPRVIDYMGFLQRSNRPTFRWPADERWVQKLKSENAMWILVNSHKFRRSVRKQNPILNPFWPEYELVYTESTINVFRHKSVRPQAESINISDRIRPGRPPAYEGYHDITNCNGIMGWAWDRSRPDDSISVELYDGNTLLATMTADQFRQDLLDNNIGKGKHGFTYVVPPFLKDGATHIIRMKFAGTNIELANTPKEINCTFQ